MNKIAKLQARICAISNSEVGMATFEKVVLIIGGVVVAGAITFFVISVIGDGKSDNGLAGTVKKKIQGI